MSGVKFDDGKPAMHLITSEFMYALAEVLGFGAKIKYSPRNWEQGMDWSRYFAALQRHMWKWWSGETNDSESGMSHLAHAAFCVMVLVTYQERNIGTDDRESLKKVTDAMDNWIQNAENVHSTAGGVIATSNTISKQVLNKVKP